MCFNYKSSIVTFFIGIIGSFVLIKYGNKKYSKENVVSAIFILFISGIQFMDFLLWIDLENKLGINKLTTIIGPLFNVGQPIILYITKLLFFKPKDIFTINHYNLPILILNVIYFIDFIIRYIIFITSSTLITHVKHGHLLWPWMKYSNHLFYLILFAINIFYLMDFKYALVLFLITYSFFFLSVLLFSYNVGELWCFFGTFIPYIMCFMSYYL